MFSVLKAIILILQYIWRPYQAKTRKNILRQWMMKFKFLLEGTHGRLFQGSQLLITMCFQKHGISSIKVNLIGQSRNSSQDIV